MNNINLTFESWLSSIKTKPLFVDVKAQTPQNEHEPGARLYDVDTDKAVGPDKAVEHFPEMEDEE